MDKEIKQHWIAATLLGLGALLVIVVFVVMKTSADKTINVSASTTNAIPTATINYITNATSSTIESDGSALTLTDGTVTTVHIKGTFSDDNGCTDVTSGGRMDGVIYHGSSPDCVGGSPESAHCFLATSCSLSSCSGTTGQFDCSVPVWFNADPTNTGSLYEADTWKAIVNTQDATMIGAGGGSANLSSPRTFEIAQLTAISLSGDIAFGSMGLNATTSSVALSITNTGNKEGEGVAITGTDMTCTPGVIPVQNIKFATTNVSYDSMTALNSDHVTAVSTGLSIGSSFATSTVMASTTYFNLKTPASDVNGTCTGTLTFSTE